MGAVVGGVIGAVGSIIGGSQMSKAQQRAAEAQERIARENLAFQKEMYEKDTARMQPWVDYGATHRDTLSQMMPELTERYDLEKYYAGPEYMNTMAQTERERNALMAQASASGMYGSGTMANQLQANAAYLGNQGYQQGLQNYMAQNATIYDMLDSASTQGLNAAGQMGTLGSMYAGRAGSILDSIGNTQYQSQYNQGVIKSGITENLAKLGAGVANELLGDFSMKDLFSSAKSPTGAQVNMPSSSYQQDYQTGVSAGNWSGNPAYNAFLGRL